MNSTIIPWILGLVAAFLAVKWQASAKENEVLKQQLSEKKANLYADFINVLMNAIHNKIDQDAMSESLRNINEKVVLIASNKVLLTYGDVVQLLLKNRGELDTPVIMRAIGELIVSMREDVGHKDWLNSIYWFDCLRPWINDIEAFIPARYRHLRGKYNKYLNPDRTS